MALQKGLIWQLFQWTRIIFPVYWLILQQRLDMVSLVFAAGRVDGLPALVSSEQSNGRLSYSGKVVGTGTIARGPDGANGNHIPENLLRVLSQNNVNTLHCDPIREQIVLLEHLDQRHSLVQVS
ncbi:hypothetical protein KI387_030289, partial [Taxus chinensis]